MTGDLWIFAYGSLMWRPDFVYQECQPALLRGWHRAMCVLSVHYRGTPERPGLVLGLDRGGACRGRAFRVAAADSPAVLDALHEREMINNVYDPRTAPVTLSDARRVPGYCFVVRRDHPQYAGRLTIARQAKLIRQGSGLGGSARDYLAATVAHLDQMGIGETSLHRLLAAVQVDSDAKPRYT